MTREQAEMRAARYNRMARHPSLSYMAHPMARTKWERDRWGVVQIFGSEPYPFNIAGIAAV